MTTTDPNTTDLEATVDTYLAALNETDAGRRATLVAEAFTPDARYVDPLSDLTGPEEFAAMVDGAHAQFPGQAFRRTSGIDLHHDVVRFEWTLGAEGAEPTVAGIDVGRLAPDGRLAEIIAFFGPVPAS